MAYRPPSPAALRRLCPDRRLLWPDYADAWLSFPLGRLLDCGCGRGEFLRRVADRCSECWGADIDPEQLAAAAAGVPGHIRRIVPGEPLPFPDAFFDTVVSLEVVEHVADERAFLAELSRVLIPGGHLLITTPHKGLLTFLDPGNFKFSAPGLHRFFHCTILRNREYYEQRFGDARRRDLGMLADFTVGQSPWHRHYSAARLRALAPPQLRTVAWSAYYPAYRAIESLFLALKVVTRGRLRSHLPPAPWVERHLSRCMTILGD